MDSLDLRSSSNELSSAPSSDIEGPFLTRPRSSSTAVVVSRDSYGPTVASKPTTSRSKVSAARQDDAPAKQRKPRKKKEVDPNGPPAPEKDKKPRKPRAPTGTTGSTRKKQKTEDDSSSTIISQHPPHISDLSASRLVQPTSFANENKPPVLYEAAKITQNGFSKQNPLINSQPQSPAASRYQTTPQPQPAAPRSRDIFDPVRGNFRASEQTQVVSYSTSNETPPRHPSHPSASPAIFSILNHPEVTDTKSQSCSQSSNAYVTSQIKPQEISMNNSKVANVINLDGIVSDATVRKVTPTDKPEAEAEAKPKRAKEQPPQMPTGSGLLNSTFFGGSSTSDRSTPGEKSVSIVLDIPLQRGENKIFNFARMAEDKYGFAAVYPRQAAHKERLAKMAAVGAALERSASNGKRGEVSIGESGDEDLSVDIDRDSENDGDIAMTGINGTNENSGTDGPAPKQRKKRRDEYDAEDPFVDDSEMLWEAQAAASKDGFFVFMGPLVPETEKPPIERTEGASKRGRGRGRGGGPGSRGGRGGAASAAGKEGSGRGGASSRGGGITRKPRITKAERAQRDEEKKNREQQAAALSTKAPPVIA